MGLTILLISIILSLVLNWVLIHFSINLGERNISKTEEIRWQSKKPSLGGLTFFITFITLNSFLQYFNRNYDSKELGIIISFGLGFIIGLIDDAKNTNPLLKLFGQILCGIILVYFGITIHICDNLLWNGLFTIFWVVFLMNSINMLDNMDGLTSIIAIIILSTICFYSNLSINFNLKIIIIIGSLIGFLCYNWHPSKIYMGDSGSQFTGIVLSVFSILILWNERIPSGGFFQINQFLLPFLVFTIPIFDTSTVFIHRLLRGQSPFVGGKDHISHHLVYLGFKDSQAVLVLGLIQVLYSAIGIYFSWKLSHYSYIYIYMFIIWIASFLVFQIFYIKAKKHQEAIILSSSN